jgi:hypothetical protein
MQDQLIVSSSVLPSCAQQHSSRRHHHRHTAHVVLTSPPLPELGHLLVQMLPGQVLAAAAAATALRRLRACTRPCEGSWKCEKVQKGR